MPRLGHSLNNGVASTDLSLGPRRTTALLQPNCVLDTPINGVEAHSGTPRLDHSPNHGVEKAALIQADTASRTSPERQRRSTAAMALINPRNAID